MRPRTAGDDRIRAVYLRYDTSRRWLRKRDPGNPGFSQLQHERWLAIAGLLEARLRGAAAPRVLDVGCGTGADLARIAALRPDAELFGVDLIEARVEAARRAVPAATLRVQGGEVLPFGDRSVQLVLLSTVFSSILDPGARRRVAAEAYRVVSDDGLVLVYDIRLPSPANRNVRPVGARQLRALFPGARIESRPITLLPPLARGCGRIWPDLYRPLAGVRPLRSHYLSVVTRPR